MNQGEPCSYLALGDSYTIGEGIQPLDRWCDQLSRRLSESGQPASSPDVIAQTGWTTGDLLNAIRSKGTTSRHYSIVSLLVGVNNHYRGQSPDTYRTEFRELLTSARTIAGSRGIVIVLSIPDYSVTPFALSMDRDRVRREIDDFNRIAQSECEDTHIDFINITDLSRLAAHDGEMLAPDGLHYSGKMYALWVNQVLPFMQDRTSEDVGP